MPALCQWGSPTFSDQEKFLVAHCLNWKMLEVLLDLKSNSFILSKDGLAISTTPRLGSVPTCN